METLESLVVFGQPLHVLVAKGVYLAVVIAVTLVVQRFLLRWVREALEKTKVPKASIFVNMVKALIWAVALLWVLRPVFGISPDALITALGVSSLVVSFGMQDTVSNVVGGMGLMLTKVIQPGDYITLNGITGEVTDVTWRHTVIRDRVGNTEVVPNSVLNKTALTRLTPRLACEDGLSISVKEGADLDEVERDILKRAGGALEGIADEGQPMFILFEKATASGCQGTLYYHVKSEITFAAATDKVVRALDGADWLA